VTTANDVKRVIKVAGIVVGVCVALVLAHLALIEVGREVVVVNEPTPTGVVHKARLWIVDEGKYSWIHPGSANAQWWIRHMDANPTVEIYRAGESRWYRAQPDPDAHARVHQLLREKYGIADVWVRLLEGTGTQSGIITGEKCKTVPIRPEPIGERQLGFGIGGRVERAEGDAALRGADKIHQLDYFGREIAGFL
jgi:hypothetical protein